MKVKSQESRVKSRTGRCAALVLAMAMLLSTAIRAHAQCYIDPVTGQRVCPPAPISPSGAAAPALDSRLLTLDYSAHCRITVGDGTAGSGTLVARSQTAGLVLTCSHLFDGTTANIVVAFPNGQRFAAAIVERDRAHDLTALVIRRPDVEPVPLDGDAISQDREGASVLTACGFGPNGQFRCVRGGVAGQATPVGATYPSLLIRGAVRPGDSGGGVLNSSGQLVGVVWGQRDGMTYATCGRPIRALLDRILAGGTRLPAGAGVAGKPATKPQLKDPSPPAQSEASPQIDWPAWRDEIESRIRALDAAKQDKGDYLRQGDLQSVSGRFESIASRVESVHERIEKVAGDRGGFFQGLSIGKLLVGALGLSGPLAAAVMVAGALARGAKSRAPLRVAAKRLAATGHHEVVGGARDGDGAQSSPIAVDTPPPPQQTVPETHYVPYEKDSFAKAHQWACEQVVRKYPGATELLHAQDSLIKQYLAAR